MSEPAPLSDVIARALSGVSPRVVFLEQTGSTNDDARAMAREGAAHLSVVVADHQTAGRGRHGRRWTAAPGKSLLASWVVRPDLAVERWPVLPLLVGVACAEAIEQRTRVGVSLKWPNDLLAGDRKLGGILVEAEPPAHAVAGAGINVAQTSFPPDLNATSIVLEGGIRLDRADLLAAILRAFSSALEDPDGALERYRERCATLGRRVRVAPIAGDPLEGVARAIDPSGALIVDDGAGGRAIGAGDVEHLR